MNENVAKIPFTSFNYKLVKIISKQFKTFNVT